MGYYLEVPGLTHGKALALSIMHDGRVVSRLEAAEAMADPTKGVIVVIDNGPFEAAGFAFDTREWDELDDPADDRPRRFVVMDRETARKASGQDKRD